MNKYIVNYSLPQEDYIKDVLVLVKLLCRHSTLPTIRNGAWPLTIYNKDEYTIELPFKKKGRAYYDKLKMFTAHEVGHVLYTWDNSHKDKILKLSKFENIIHNYLEDIRIECAIETSINSWIKYVLPLSFKDFRYLLHYQLGQESTNIIDLTMYKIQWYLMRQDFDAGEEANLLFETKVEGLVSALKRIYQPYTCTSNQAILLTIEIAKQLAQLFKNEMPEQTQEKESENKSGESETGHGSSTRDAENNTGDDEGSRGEDRCESGGAQADESDNKEARGADRENTEDEHITSIPLSTSVDGEDAEGDEYIDDDKLQRVITTYYNDNIIPIVYIRSKEEGLATTRDRIKHVHTTYASSIELFKKLFSGGWRAPRRSIRREREQGDLDVDFLYKARFRGKERTLYQSTHIDQLPGVSVLCLLDISGSMSDYIKEVVDTSIILSQSATKDIKMRVVLFTDVLVQVKDYDSKFVLPQESYIQSIMGGTPTGEALDKEYKNFMYRGGDKLLVIVTDGQPNNIKYTQENLLKYKEAGVPILYIQFGDNTDIINNYVTYTIKSKNVKQLPKVLPQELYKVLHSYALQKLKLTTLKRAT